MLLVHLRIHKVTRKFTKKKLSSFIFTAMILSNYNARLLKMNLTPPFELKQD